MNASDAHASHVSRDYLELRLHALEQQLLTTLTLRAVAIATVVGVAVYAIDHLVHP
jgi:hypothetical protein